MMASSTSEDLPASVRKCFSLWRSAKSDNERLAVLLLVAKVMRNEDVGFAARRRIFDTIGFTFINRLLVTEYDEEKAGYQQVAVAILVCFCTDTELSLHPQITSKIPTLIDLLTAKSSSPSLIADCLHCIQSLAASDKGRQHLWRYDTLGSLCRYWLLQREDGSCEVTKEVILRLLCDSQLIASNPSSLSATLEYLSSQFKCRQDKQKFDICQLLKDMIMVGGNTTKDAEQVWLGNIAVGLQDILQSKLDAEHRNTALSLAGVICQKHGAQWMLLSSTSREKSKFIHLLTHLVCVEVRLVLNGQEMSAIFPHTSLLSSCFSVMEQVVVFLAQATQDSQHLLSEEDQLQLHTTLMDGFSVVVHFLQSASEQDEAITDEETTMERLKEKLLTIAAVRVLGAWMAEDSLALSSEVYSLIPFLVNLCKEEEEDVLIFLLPGFSHLLAEDKPRHALISAGLCRQLVKHFAKQSTLAQAGEDALSTVKDQLCLLCSMGLTVCVCEPTPFTGEEVEETLSQWANLLLSFISKHQGSASSLLNLHCAALCSMLLRRQQGHSQPPVPVVQDILHVLVAWLMQWHDQGNQWSDEGGELWHIAVRELSALVRNDDPDMQKNMMHISDVTKITEIMGTLSNSSNKLEDEQHAVMTSLSLFLSSVVLDTT